MKTVKARIALVVDSNGEWCANGYHDQTDSDVISWALEGLESWGEAIYWVEVEVPVPTEKTIGSVAKSEIEEVLEGIIKHCDAPDPETSTEDIDRARVLLERLRGTE